MEQEQRLGDASPADTIYRSRPSLEKAERLRGSPIQRKLRDPEATTLPASDLLCNVERCHGACMCGTPHGRGLPRSTCTLGSDLGTLMT